MLMINLVGYFMKKGQVSMFIIIGILLVVLVAAGFFLANKDRNTDLKDKSKGEASFSTNMDRFVSFRESCVQDSINTAITEHGLYSNVFVEENLEATIEIELTKCLNLEFFSDWGTSVTIFRPYVDVKINDETIIVTGAYPIRVKDKEFEKGTNEFTYTFDKTTNLDLKTDKDGNVIEDSILKSADDDLTIEVAKEVSFEDYDGKKLVVSKSKLLGFNHLA
jgi:hypothetical protein